MLIEDELKLSGLDLLIRPCRAGIDAIGRVAEDGQGISVGEPSTATMSGCVTSCIIAPTMAGRSARWTLSMNMAGNSWRSIPHLGGLHHSYVRM